MANFEENEFAIQKGNELRLSWIEFLKSWDWDLHITIRFNQSLTNNTAIKKVNLYLRSLKENIPVMFAGVIFSIYQSSDDTHAHILLVSKSRKVEPKNLSDIPKEKIENLCPYQCHVTSAKEVKSSNVFAKYLCKEKNLPIYHLEKNHEVSLFRKNLLLQLKKK